MLYPPLHHLQDKINSKYLIATTAAKRARELQADPDHLLLDRYESKKNSGPCVRRNRRKQNSSTR